MVFEVSTLEESHTQLRGTEEHDKRMVILYYLNILLTISKSASTCQLTLIRVLTSANSLL